MNAEELSKLCQDLPEVTTDIKWEDHLCFSVKRKMFCIVSPDKFPVTASFKTKEEDFTILIEQDGFSPAPYLARHKWVFVDDLNRFTEVQWIDYIQKAYKEIIVKLPKSVKASLEAQLTI